MITRYADYLDQMVMYVPGCPMGIILNALKRAGRNFCIDSEVWRADLSIDTVDGESDYTLPLPSRTALKRIVEGGVVLRGGPLEPDQYGLGVSELRADEHAPAGALYVASGEGICDEASPVGYYKLYEDTDGFTVLDGVDISFRLLVDKLATRVSLQKTEPAEIAGWKIEGSTDPIGAYTAVIGTGAISIAAVSGTVIPSPVLEMETPAATTEIGGLVVTAVLVPEHKTDGLPIDLLNRYGEGIVGGAMDILMRMPGKPWTNHIEAAESKKEYFTQINRARKDNLSQRRY